MKKIIIILCCLMLFLFPPKMNDDFVFQDNSNVMEVEAGAVTTYLTWEAIKAAAVAAGSAVAPVAVGVVGAAAIGWVIDETIGWDVIADYGQGIIDNVTGKGGTIDDIFDEETETVKITPEFVEGVSTAIDDVSTRRIVETNGWVVVGGLTFKSNTTISVSVPKDHYFHIQADVIGTTNGYYGYHYSLKANYNYDSTNYNHLLLNDLVSRDSPLNYQLDKRYLNTSNYTRDYTSLIVDGLKNNDSAYLDIANVRYIVYPSTATIPEDVIYSDELALKETLPDSIDARNTIIYNNVNNTQAIPLNDTQAVTGVSFAEMASATEPEDLDEDSANDLGILGILALIYNFIKELPIRLVGAFTSLFNMIINAIKAIPDAIASGIDNLLININAVGSNIRAGIDDLLIDINGVGANIRAGIDNLLINVSAIPDAIASGIDNLLINMGDWTDSLINTWVSGLGVIIGGINDIWSWLTGFGEWLIALVVPTSLAALQPSITSLTGTFNDKFAFIIAPIKSFGNAYSESKSLYDVTFNLKYRDIDKDVHVLPIAYKPAVDVFRLVANGVVVVLTYISMYNRFRKEVLT